MQSSPRRDLKVAASESNLLLSANEVKKKQSFLSVEAAVMVDLRSLIAVVHHVDGVAHS